MQGNKPGLIDGGKYILKQGLMKWNQYSGPICTVAGTAGLIFTGVHACRKTYKIHDKLKEHGKYIDENGKTKWKKVKAIAKVSGKTAKDYALDAIIGGVSAAAVAKGWHSEHKNYKNAAAMVGIVMADFMNYRHNVISEQGAEADRRYLTTKNNKVRYIDDGKLVEKENTNQNDAHIVQVDKNDLRIWFSKYTTPQVWTDSHALRLCRLNDIQNRLNMDLMYGGNISVNDVRREFYGRKGDCDVGGMFGRIWDPGDPAHPERGAYVNLHFEEDENFMAGLTDSCWIIIDIDEEPLFELLKKKKNREMAESI